MLVTPVFLPTQRKTLDLSLQPAAAPSSGKTLPIPVQITLRFNLPKEREAVPGSPDQPLSSSSCVQPNHRSTVRTGCPGSLPLFPVCVLSTRRFLEGPHRLGGVGLGLGWRGRPPGEGPPWPGQLQGGLRFSRAEAEQPRQGSPALRVHPPRVPFAHVQRTVHGRAPLAFRTHPS